MTTGTSDRPLVDAEARALLQASETLARILERENRTLRTSDADARAMLLDAKIEAGRSYEAAVSAFAEARQAAPADAIDTRLAARLKSAGERLAARTEENERYLRVAVAAQRRLLETIAQAVRRLNPGPGTYGRNGSLARPRRSCAAPPSLSLDRAL